MIKETFFKKDWGFFLVCLSLGILAEELLFRGQIGVSAPVFIVVFYFVFFYKLSGEGFLSQRLNLLLFLCIWALTFSYILYTNPILRGLNYAILPILIVVQIALSSSSKTVKWYEMGFLAFIFKKIRGALKYNQQFIVKVFRVIFKGANEQTYYVIKRMAIGLCIAAPIGLIITSLLMSADLKFANLISDLPQWAIQWINQELVLRLLLILLITMGLFGYFQVVNKKESQNLNSPGNAKTQIQWDGVIALTVLLLLNGVYFLFTLVQFKYFFGQTLQGDLTYAMYARRGFAELVVVTILNLTILVCVLSFVKINHSKLGPFLQLMLSLLVGFSGVLLVSAYIRLSMYEEAYGYTMLRVLVQAFMIFLTLIFIYTLITIWLNQLSLVRFYLLSGLIYYTMLNIVPLDQVVIQNNLARLEKTGKIDVNYLNQMSSSGVVCLVNLYKKDPSQPGLRGILEEDQNKAMMDHASWQSFNLEKQQANKLLRELILKK